MFSDWHSEEYRLPLDVHAEPFKDTKVTAVDTPYDTWKPRAIRQAADREVRITDPKTGGQKGQKLAQLGAIDPQALMQLAEVAGHGAQKYARLNFMKGYNWSLSYDACQRHLHAFWSGENLDQESGLPHLAHAGWHCMAMLAFMNRELGEDDRYEPVHPEA